MSKETKVVVPGRLSYVNVFEPKSINGSDPKYSISIIIPKTDKKTVNVVMKAIEAAKQEGAPKFGGKIPANLKTPLRDGDIDRPDDPAYEGCYFINSNSKNAPQVVDDVMGKLASICMHSMSTEIEELLQALEMSKS